MHRSKKCKQYVANATEGLPSHNEVEGVIKVLQKQLESKRKAGKEENAESDDERSSYCDSCDYNDDFVGGGED